MPIYEYLCEKCEVEFERDQRITDDPVKTCPKCRSRKVKRLISRTSFVLKGGGWYNDLYSSSKGKSKDSDSSSDDSSKPDGAAAEAKSDSSAGDKADSKPKSEKPKSEKAAAGKSKTGKSKSAAA